MPPKAVPCRLPPPPPQTATEMAGKLRLGREPGISVQLACMIGVAAACGSSAQGWPRPESGVCDDDG
jgi:hypothetical protein